MCFNVDTTHTLHVQARKYENMGIPHKKLNYFIRTGPETVLLAGVFEFKKQTANKRNALHSQEQRPDS